MTIVRRRAVVAPLLVAVLVAGCTAGGSDDTDSTPSRVPTTSSTSSVPSSTAVGGNPPPSTPPTTTAARNLCPATYAAPDPDRPVVGLRFTVSADHSTVTGHETVRFTPDRPVTELVFRLTPNTAPSVEEGNSLRVTSAFADHGGAAARYERAGAAPSTQGGLLIIPLRDRVAVGQPVTAVLDFVITLGRDSFDRYGRSGSFAWFASAHPLLAWERGYGWHTEPLIRFTAESATSEAADTSLTVITPARDTVLASGRPVTPVAAGSGTRRWTSTITAARDVSVAVGPFVVRDAKIGTVDVRVGADSAAGADGLLAEQRRAIVELAKRFGPFPFPTLSVSQLPGSGGGIEYPSSIFLLGVSRLVVVHETAHQWFYAMVGDSQAQHAWLDEAFASYAEQQVDGDPPGRDELDAPGTVDTPTADYGSDSGTYYRVTYDKGSAALHAARAAAGAAKFDAAIRCYVNANAWRITQPKDLAVALRGLPAAIEVLKKAGALR